MDKTLKVLCFDPGVTTGYAIGVIVPGEPMEVGSGQERWDVDDQWEFLVDQQPDHLIYERFEHRNRARSGLEYFSRELIGIYRLYTRIQIGYGLKQMPVTIEHARMPGQDWSYFTDRRLKEMNVYKAGKDHAMDATRHLLGWYEFGYGFQFHAGPARPS